MNVDDDETAALTVSGSPVGLVEGGAGGSFTVALATPPTQTVTVTVTSADTGAVTASPGLLTFTAANWDTAQTVTVAAVDDADAGDESVSVGLAGSGGEYAGVTGAATVTVDDDEAAALTVSGSPVGLVEGGAGGSFTVALATPPTQTVTVTVTSADTGAVTASPGLLTFTAANWDTAQTVTVAAVDDADAGDESVSVGLAGSGGEYAGVTGAATVTVDDDETAALDVSVAGLVLPEGGAGSFTVALATPPTGTVTVDVVSANAGAVTVDKPLLTFTASDWNTAQTVTVTAVNDDNAVNENVNVNLSASGGEYDGVTDSVSVRVNDDDTPALEVSVTSLSVTEGATDSFTVALATEPTAQVTVTVTSTDTDAVSVDKASLTFTTSDWDTEQTVTVSGVPDDDALDESEWVRLAASGGDYAGLTGNVRVGVDDDDTAALGLSVTSLSVTEGATDSFTVALATRPGPR